MSGRSCVAELQDVLVELGVFSSRDILAKGGSIPCHSWKSITQYVLAVLIVYYIWNVRCKHTTRLLST